MKDYTSDNPSSTSMKEAIDKLCSYIPYFEDAHKDKICQWVGGEKTGDNTYTAAYPKYDQTLLDFIDEVYSSNLMHHEYLDVINSKGLNGTREMSDAIDTADLELLTAILTGYVRQERFYDGLWADAVEDKTFLKILRRLQQL